MDSAATSEPSWCRRTVRALEASARSAGTRRAGSHVDGAGRKHRALAPESRRRLPRLSAKGRDTSATSRFDGRQQAGLAALVNKVLCRGSGQARQYGNHQKRARERRKLDSHVVPPGGPRPRVGEGGANRGKQLSRPAGEEWAGVQGEPRCQVVCRRCCVRGPDPRRDSPSDDGEAASTTPCRSWSRSFRASAPRQAAHGGRTSGSRSPGHGARQRGLPPAG